MSMLRKHLHFHRLWGVCQVATRQGVCSGLKEVLENVTRQQLAEHLGTLLPLVQGALLDTDPSVRQVSLHIRLKSCLVYLQVW